MKNSSSAFFISLIYFLISLILLLFSDELLFLITKNPETIANLQDMKAWIFIIISSIFIYFMIKLLTKKHEKSKDELEKIFNSLASPTMLFNEDGKILMINKIFEELTGYKYKEIDTIEKWTRKAYGEKALEVKEIINSLYSVDDIVDAGVFQIMTKNDKKICWHFNTAPFGIKNGKRTIIATALDVTELKEKEKMMIQQSKMAAMGEILENIAHQWRQPLSTISTASTGIKLQNEHGILTNEIITESMDMINKSAQHLSKTIDDFRGFFKPDQKKEFFKVKHTFEKIIMIIGNKFDGEKINFISEIEDFQILNYNNALIQVLINIFTNSKDVFNEKKIKDRFIFVDVSSDEYSATIQIKDNAGGISSKIIDKVFEPYFTTKHQAQGTGIGLYMSEELITKHMKGKIKVENSKFLYDGKKYSGALFTITLPLKI
ncbi:PAS domain-containing sensor histidine kinase [Arcobacter sp. LA11]|uniref:PAS domain-containing sensor histidine kinase n=1 Tax=Arcobacter sp. LA11 TaxID=1898176 RepID=UPI0009338CBB|nr:PAS domain-containing sensor histidine kinase [Arcobacter sp. LA11]